MDGDVVDQILEQWAGVEPQLDVSPMAVIGRISRLSRIIDVRLAEHFAAHGIDDWMYDVLATLHRAGEPPELTPSELVAHTMVTTGAMTNRLDRLEARGRGSRRPDADDRRRVVVALTPEGRAVVEAVAPGHYRLEASLLGALGPRQRADLARTLRRLLVELGDTPRD